VKVSCQLLSVTADENQGVSVDVLFELVNVGGHVAQSVTICPALAPIGDASRRQEPYEVFKKFTPENPPRIGTVLFPHDPRRESHLISISKTQVDESWQRLNWPDRPFPERPFLFGVAGCVVYSYELSKRWHHTYFAYDILRPQPTGGLATANMSDLSGVQLIDMPLGQGKAD
jgi:hypothetical protein